MKKQKFNSWFLAFTVSLGGFLYGFDAGIISGVMNYVTPEFNLNTTQQGWIPSSPLFSAMFTMLIAGRLSDQYGRKKILIGVAILYVLSALFSALSFNYHMLWISRMLGGIAFGAALVIAPIYIAEIATSYNRGRLVALQQLNIVLGFFAAFLSNYYLNKAYENQIFQFLTTATVWRWMLAIELVPAVFYLSMLFFVPESPRWFFAKGQNRKGRDVLNTIHGASKAKKESEIIENAIKSSSEVIKNISFSSIFNKKFKFILGIGILIGIIQQATGINAVYYYATSIFKRTGIGTDASFFSGVLLSLTTLVFTLVAFVLIDRFGRRPLFLLGLLGITGSMFACGLGFQNATYTLRKENLTDLNVEIIDQLRPVMNQSFDSDTKFLDAIEQYISESSFLTLKGRLIEESIHINPYLVLTGILGFVACFAFSLGPVMWVMLSELFPNRLRGIMIGFVGFINGFFSWFVTQIFPWEIENLGNTYTFYIYSFIAGLGLLFLYRILPETKNKSLEALESEFIES